jgi:Putative transposase
MDCNEAQLLPTGVRALKAVPALDAGKAGRSPRRWRTHVLGQYAHLKAASAFAKFIVSLRRKLWFIYAKESFAGPKAVLAYLSRYTHRVAISNSLLIKVGSDGLTFRVKNYHVDGDARSTTMTLASAEFICRVLLHALRRGFHRIRRTGFLASSSNAENIARALTLLAVASPEPASAGAMEQSATVAPARTCP